MSPLHTCDDHLPSFLPRTSAAATWSEKWSMLRKRAQVADDLRGKQDGR
jgi:P2-related tail formation protein